MIGLSESPCTVAPAAESSASEWDAFVRTHPAGSGYHLWAWRHIFEDVFGYECALLAARRGESLVGVLPVVKFRSWLFGRALISLPFVNYGGVLAGHPAYSMRRSMLARMAARTRPSSASKRAAPSSARLA